MFVFNYFYIEMTHIEIEHESIKDESIKDESDSDTHDDVIKSNDEANDLRIEQTTQELNKPVKQLTKSERETIINEFNNGVDNKYYKCHKLKNGSIRITKRANPLTNNAETAHEATNNKINNRINTTRLTDNQLLLEHIIDLEKRYEIMRMKHKKLKKRYNKLETDLFDDDSDEPLNIKEITAESAISDAHDDEEKPVKITFEKPVVEQIDHGFRTIKRPIKRGSWRDAITSF